jgi:CRISPR system Cascade subunit CasA
MIRRDEGVDGLRPTFSSFVSAALALAGAGLLQACAHYSPAPLSLTRVPAALRSARLPPRPAGVAWSESELVEVALMQGPPLAQAQASYVSARAAARAARIPPPMTLNLTAEYSKDAGGTSPWLFGTTSDIPLDFGARRSVRLGAADLAALQALYDFGEAAWTQRMAVRRAVIERAFADREAIVADRLVRLRRDRFERLGLRLRAGEEARPVVLMAQTDLAAAEKQVLDIAGRRAQSDVALAKALGVEAPAVEALVISPPAEMFSESVDPRLEAWRTEAVLSRRDVLRAVADYDLAEGAVRLEIAKQYPEVHLDPGYTWERGVTKWPFTVSLVLPPYDLNRAAIATAEARRAEAGRKLEAAQAGVLAAVDQARQALATAAAVQARAAAQDLPLARRTAATAANSLAAGEIDRVDLDAADAAAGDAEINALEAARQAMLAEADLEDALRRSFDPAETGALQAAVDRARAAA